MSLASRTAALRIAQRIAPATAPGDDIIHVLIFANAAGNNIVVPSPNRAFDVLEIKIWNGVGAQTVQIKDGTLVVLDQMTNMPAPFAYFGGFSGNGQPHYRISNGNPLILNLSLGSQIDGFVKYRLR